MRTNVLHILAIGEMVGQPMQAHKAVHEVHVVAEAITGELQSNKELVATAYTDLEVARLGLTEYYGLVRKAPRCRRVDSPGLHRATRLPMSAMKV